MNYANENARTEFNAFFGDTSRKSTPTVTPSTVGFKRLTETAVLPTKAFPSDSGWDLYADADVIIKPGETLVVKTSIAVVLPQGYEASVRPRSGITSKTKLRVQYGSVDNSYRGDIGIIVDNISIGFDDDMNRYGFVDGTTHLTVNLADGTYIIRKGDKLAQLVVSPVATFAGVEITDLDETTRGSAGFGSTGVRKSKEDE